MTDPTPETETSRQMDLCHLAILQRARDQAQSEADRWQRKVDEQLKKMHRDSEELYEGRSHDPY